MHTHISLVAGSHIAWVEKEEGGGKYLLSALYVQSDASTRSVFTSSCDWRSQAGRSSSQSSSSNASEEPLRRSAEAMFRSTISLASGRSVRTTRLLGRSRARVRPTMPQPVPSSRMPVGEVGAREV